MKEFLNGFDTSRYPGADVMRELKDHFDFCGFYLGPSPSHRGGDWMEHREFIHSLGYSIAPIYVGSQVTGPGSRTVTPEEGAKHAAHCVSLMERAGFGEGDPVYLDLENGPPLAASQKRYTGEWFKHISAAGYRPGVYCSHRLASYFDHESVLIWRFKVPTTSKTYSDTAMALKSAPNPLPHAMMEQYRQNVVISWLDDDDMPDSYLVDLNTAHPDALSKPPKSTCEG